MPALSRVDERRFALGVLNGALGGGMSSRLFQEIREKRGLAYSVYSYAAHHAETGMFGVYAGCQPAKAKQVLDICREQVDLVARGGITADELARGKGQLAGALVLGLEDTGSRMSRLGKAELVYGEILTVDEILGRIEAVTLDQVREIAADVLTAKPTLAVIGPFDADSLCGRRRVSNVLNVAVLGAKGRMGATVCDAVRAAADLESGRGRSTSVTTSTNSSASGAQRRRRLHHA